MYALSNQRQRRSALAGPEMRTFGCAIEGCAIEEWKQQESSCPSK
jgi:hypothetical protein